METKKYNATFKERHCEFCARLYVPTNNRQKYCKDCKKQAYKKYVGRYSYTPSPRKIKKPGIKLYCRMCGKPIIVKYNYRYCCDICQAKALYLKKYEYKLRDMIDEGKELSKIDDILWKKIQHVFYRER